MSVFLSMCGNVYLGQSIGRIVLICSIQIVCVVKMHVNITAMIVVDKSITNGCGVE